MRARFFHVNLLTLTSIIALEVISAQAVKPYGAATPQEVVATIKKAAATNDFLGTVPLISPRGLKMLASDGITAMLMGLAFSDPDDAMPGSPKVSKAELDTKRKNYKDAVDLAKTTLKPYGIDGLIGKPVLAKETQSSLDAALDKADNVVLLTSLVGAMEKIGPLLGMKESAKPRPMGDIGTVTGYKITGDKATAQSGKETLDFVRIGGRWFIEPPRSHEPSSAPGAAPAAQAGQTAAQRPAAAGTQPEIVPGGVQIANVTVAKDDFSAKPFHADNGTTLVLWVKMPAGQGLIEIDEDTSLLQSFTDDKGTRLGGKFGSFPQEFKDGSGGTIEISSTAFPAATATALLAEGTVSMNVATGTAKARVASVRLQNDAKFMLGQTSITVSDVGTEGDSQTFTLKLPRQVMTGIKNVVFLDAAGKPLDGHKSGSGYMNEAAEMSFSVKTAAKTLTLEFETWQGMKTIKVPFKVKAGIGLR